jgi:hypothetical protein
LVRAHGTPSIYDAHNPPLAPRQQDRISATYGANRRILPTMASACRAIGHISHFRDSEVNALT